MALEELSLPYTALAVELAEQTGRPMPADAKGGSLALQWLMFQMGGIGPMMGQANVFFRYVPEKMQPANDRDQNESRRLFEMLDHRLGQTCRHCQLVLGRTCKCSGVNADGLPHLRRWLDAMKARAAWRCRSSCQRCTGWCASSLWSSSRTCGVGARPWSGGRPWAGRLQEAWQRS